MYWVAYLRYAHSLRGIGGQEVCSVRLNPLRERDPPRKKRIYARMDGF